MICENCEKELDKCGCCHCSNCGHLHNEDDLDRNGHCEDCQAWRCETCGLDLEDCDCE